MQYIRTYIRQETWDDLPTRAKEILQKHLKGITIIPDINEVEESKFFHDIIKQAFDTGHVSVDPIADLFGND